VDQGGIEEVVADKGYHSGPRLQRMRAAGVPTYIPEKKQAGKGLGRQGRSTAIGLSELTERTFAHWYDTGSMRRTHLRKHNILKRLLIHVAGSESGIAVEEPIWDWNPARPQVLPCVHSFLLW
jgi:hypothetical protein